MTKIVSILFLIGIMSWNACNRLAVSDYGKTPVMEVAGQTLYYEDIMEIMPAGLSPTDSSNFAENYIHRWAVNALLYDKAANNVDMKDINRRTEQFKRELIINEYKRGLVENRMKDISEDSIAAFYEKQKDIFPLKEAVVKGVYLKVPANAKKRIQLEKWLEDLNDGNLDNIMRYCTQYALDCKFFNDTWTNYPEIASLMPEQKDSNDPALTRGTIIQYTEKEIHYLKISGLINAGKPMPLEMAAPDILNILTNKQKHDIIRNFENELYQEAIEDRQLRTFNRDEQ